MFTKEAYKEYFLQILELEEEMVREARELADRVDDPEIRQVMLRIMMDEQRHVGYVHELIELIESPD
ncbi:ferritin-like domain-containing protein [Prosthecochloris sp. HL-130-GSB]|jgi:rubrerythrin|uniref:Ferritin-like domain-containing protein n=1 Tax=Prosthecochloris aestuarii TaxID=1102 RepID=A0A831SSI8_PROAE|nr:ferritin-like domain-containing protein [Prosthecochloris sp. HL-130-GSB]ARM30849.1 hypothetical protein B9H02_05435 [Prosthecochloris sp. HL-130-GSB]MBO8093694.1 ferritin-like domain-containing protein [Prosthecochloris sp.]HED31308.1 ferritin-like domain-containing protein [Prosthecochloris aestuarii]